MSRALKCDRCKKCFDPYAEGVEFIRFDDIVLQDNETFSVNGCIFREDLRHLCPECANEFLDWFDMDKKILEKRIAYDQKRKKEEQLEKEVMEMNKKPGTDDLLKKMQRIYSDMWRGEKKE